MRLTILLLITAFGVISCSSKNQTINAGDAAPQLSTDTLIEQRVLVIGGTAGTGLETVKLALERGHSVTVMARRPERMPVSHDRLTVIKADILDPDSVSTAVAGKDTVIISVGTKPTRKPVNLFSAGTSNVLAAMTNHGVQRVIIVTGIGAGNSRGHGGFFYDKIMQPLFLDTIYEDKDRAEKIILDSHQQWTIVRPGFLTDEMGKASYRVITDLEDITAGNISRSDVAHFMVSSLETNSYITDTVLLTN
ncbi:NAD(P)-dependent oxidoreductase [Oceanicoccus sp. KOV_DT_Chl]|uniref:NAD(P)-dependent oxidoreductase n=1 Tax=Oceanicoccus sp. KOV_DT_Chl TaxID=1904639 RepID=UPI000C7CBCBE|nr:SDR family oxidoreductase [Oceanicoccus sp. KOV_DT_Chl]